MKITSLSKDLLAPGWVVGKLPATVRPVIGGLTASLFLKATFRMHHDGTPSAWPDGPEFGSGDLHMEENPALGLGYASDFVPFKPQADFSAVGSAYPPPGPARMSFRARMRVGSHSKAIDVVGERRWKEAFLGAQPGSPLTAGPTLLSHANAWGGLDDKKNPLGRGRYGELMHSLELADAWVQSRSDRSEPASFAPVPASWPLRSGKTGSYGGAWLRERWPWLPGDFDFSHFNAPPPSQWINGYLRGDEELVFENMHPEHPVYRTQLPRLGARCFLKQTVDWKVDLPEEKARRVFLEVPLDLDTLWADTDREKLVLVWRGRAAVSSLKLLDIENLLILLEPLDGPAHDLRHYESLLESTLATEAEVPPVPPGPTAASIHAEIDQAIAKGKSITKELESQLAAVKAKLLNEEAVQGSRFKTEMARLNAPAPNLPAQITDEKALLDRAVRVVNAGAPLFPDEIKKLVSGASWEHPPQAAGTRTATEQLSKVGAELKASILAKLPPWITRPVPAKEDPVDVEAARKGGFASLNMREFDFSGLDLSGVSFRGTILAGAKFRKTRLRRADFTDADLSGADLTGADLTGATLNGADFHECLVAETLWRETSLDGAKLGGLPLAGADFSAAHGQFADFTGADLSGARFVESNLPRAAFTEANVEGADFTRAKLENADFGTVKGRNIQMPEADLSCLRAGRKADFSEGNFRRSSGAGSIWKNSTLDGADFQQALLTEAQFSEAILRGTRFDRCDLGKASFDDAVMPGAVLTNANLIRAIFDRADLTDSRMDGSNLYNAGFWEATLLRASWTNANVKRTRLDI